MYNSIVSFLTDGANACIQWLGAFVNELPQFFTLIVTCVLVYIAVVKLLLPLLGGASISLGASDKAQPAQPVGADGGKVPHGQSDSAKKKSSSPVGADPSQRYARYGGK